jgi:hypothetical protein
MQNKITLLPFQETQFNQLEQIRLLLNEAVNMNLFLIESRNKYRANWRSYIFGLQTGMFLIGRKDKNKKFFQHLKETRKALELYLGSDPQINDLIKEFPSLTKIKINVVLLGLLV